jgi:hypothetical protein
MTTAAENAAPAKIVHILNFMIFPQMDGGFQSFSVLTISKRVLPIVKIP